MENNVQMVQIENKGQIIYLNAIMSIIILNIKNGQHTQLKRETFPYCIKNQDSTACSLQEIHFKNKDTKR